MSARVMRVNIDAKDIETDEDEAEQAAEMKEVVVADTSCA